MIEIVASKLVTIGHSLPDQGIADRLVRIAINLLANKYAIPERVIKKLRTGYNELARLGGEIDLAKPGMQAWFDVMSDIANLSEDQTNKLILSLIQVGDVSWRDIKTYYFLAKALLAFSEHHRAKKSGISQKMKAAARILGSKDRLAKAVAIYKSMLPPGPPTQPTK